MLILFNQLGYWLAYEAMHSQIKREVRKQLVEKNELEFITIPTNQESVSLSWIKPKKEFKYKGNLYDVSSQYQKGDSTYFLVYNDKDEKRLYQSFVFQLSENKNPFHQSTPVYSFTNFIKEALILSEFNLECYFDFILNSIGIQSKYSFSLKEFSFSPNSPPPNIFIFS